MGNVIEKTALPDVREGKGSIVENRVRRGWGRIGSGTAVEDVTIVSGDNRSGVNGGRRRRG